MRKKVNWLCRLWLAAVASFFSIPGKSIEIPPYFRDIQPDGNESLIQVTAIAQDRHGFMWFGTPQGLFVHDGYESREYSIHNESGLSHNHVRVIHRDKDGEMWVGTNNGLNRFDAITGRFSPVELSVKNHSRVAIYDIHEEVGGKLWLGTSAGVMVRRAPTDDFLQVSIEQEKTGNIRAVVSDAMGGVWIGSDSAGLFKLEDQQRFKSVDRAPIPEELYVRELEIDEDGELWVATFGNGIFRISTDLSSIETLHESADPDSRIASNIVRSLYKDQRGTIWIGSDGGLQNWDRATQKMGAVILPRPSTATSELDGVVYDIFEDDMGLVWVGKFRGVSVWNPLSPRIGFLNLAEQNANDLVTGFVEIEPGLVLISTFSGLVQWDTRSGELSDIKLELDYPLNITALVSDSEDNLWLGTYGQGLFKLDRDRTLTRFQHVPNEVDSLRHDGITDLTLSESGELWISTFGGGVSLYDRQADVFINYPDNTNPDGNFSDLRCRQLEFVDADTLWIATETGGIVILSTNTGDTRILNQRNTPGMSSDSVAHFVSTDRGVWVGTVDNGVFKLDRSGELLLDKYGVSDGLLRGEVHGLVADRANRLWLSHTRGITSIELATRIVKNHMPGFGLQADFNRGADYIMANDVVLFGGSSGVNYFDPRLVNTLTNVPPIKTTDFKIFGSSKLLAEYQVDGKLLLPYFLNSIGFQFASLDYTYPQRNQYKYKLEGFDNHWIHNGTDRDVTYTNLDPGTYTLRVQGSNSDGVWNPEGLTIPIVIQPPPWATWWAYTLYAITAIFVFYQLMIFTSQREKRQAEQRFHLRILGFVESLNQASECILNADNNGRVIFLNNAAETVFGRPKTDFVGHNLLDVIFQDESDRRQAKQGIDGDKHYQAEVDFQSGDGDLRKVQVNISPVAPSPKDNLRYICTARDITENARLIDSLTEQKAESEARLQDLREHMNAVIQDKDQQLEHLRTSMRESTVLAKEIHDRINDSLQTFSSLLSIQANRLDDDSVNNALLDNRERLLAIAYIHEQLQAAEDPRRLDVSRYVDVLVSHLVRRHRSPGMNIQLHKSVDDLELSLDQAIPFGLILNELVTNSLRHGFVGRIGGGNISVSITRTMSECVLKASDDGIGLPLHPDATGHALGLEIVSVLTEQLNGRLARIGGIGTTFELRFPLSINS